MRLVEYRYRQVATDGRKIIKEDFQGFTGFEVVEQGLDRDSGPCKNGRTAMNLRINANQLLVYGRSPDRA